MWEIWEDICTSAWLYENHAVYTHMHATWHKFMKNTHQSKYPDQENACSQITAATTSPYNNRHGLCVEVTVWARHRQQETSTFTLGVSMTSASSRKSRNLQSYHLDQSDRALDCACWKSWGAFYSTKIFHQKFRDFRSEIEWNGKNSGKSFRKFRNTFWVHPFWWNFRNYRKVCVPFAREVGFATLQKNSSICFSSKIAGRPDELPVAIRPVCIIGCVLVYRYTEGITIVLLSLRTFV